MYKHDAKEEGPWHLCDQWDTECPVQAISVTTTGAFITTWHYLPRLNKGSPEVDPDAKGNMIIWSLQKAGEHSIVLRDKYPNMVRHLWPFYRFSSDEKLVAVKKQSKLYIYTTDDIGARPSPYTLTCKGLAQFSLKAVVHHGKRDEGREPEYMIGTFVPSIKDQFAKVQLFNLNDLKKPVMFKVFGRGERVEFL